jgi:hypothetical protein
MAAVAPLFFLFFGTRGDYVRGGINHEACRVYESEGFETVFVIPCVQMSHLNTSLAVPTVPFPRVSDAEHDV